MTTIITEEERTTIRALLARETSLIGTLIDGMAPMKSAVQNDPGHTLAVAAGVAHRTGTLGLEMLEKRV